MQYFRILTTEDASWLDRLQSRSDGRPFARFPTGLTADDFQSDEALASVLMFYWSAEISDVAKFGANRVGDGIK
jgi:hypothetical protein